MKASPRELARKLIRLSVAESGSLSPERVDAVLSWTRDRTPAERRRLLREYLRLARREIAGRHAIVEHTGELSDADREGLAQSLSARAGHAVTVVSRENPEILGGLRVRLGDQVLDASLAGRLERLAQSVR